jgi:hypothetical protein
LSEENIISPKVTGLATALFNHIVGDRISIQYKTPTNTPINPRKTQIFFP